MAVCLSARVPPLSGKFAPPIIGHRHGDIGLGLEFVFYARTCRRLTGNKHESFQVGRVLYGHIDEIGGAIAVDSCMNRSKRFRPDQAGGMEDVVDARQESVREL